MTEDASIPPNLPGEDEKRDGAEDGLAGLPEQPLKANRWNQIWDGLLRLGLGETALRVGTGLASIALILLVVWVMGNFYLKGRGNSIDAMPAAMAAALPTPTATVPAPEYAPTGGIFTTGIPRLASLHTNRPDRARFQMTQYTIEEGDSLFGIAEKFNIKPASILFSNQNTLFDDPHRIYPGQVLNIPPIDGAFYEWHAGDGLNGVARFFKVTPEDIINWPANNLSLEKLGDLTNPNIAPGTLVFIPGGKRTFTSWSAPFISRTDPAKARIFGPGYCGVQTDGYIGNGTFVWPTTETWLSGYDYTPDTNHWGIDVAGQLNNNVFASDSGVVVYSGWNDWGYGYVVVIDHGNGWQTLYAHLNVIYATCGMSVSQGTAIGGLGTTGRSSGPHLHFEIMNVSGARVNPHSYLIAK
jgi:murein DD-endopeptidase MepM/ murein hydrolase activator NlpD